MSSRLKKVQSGDPLNIPASAFNAFVDAALAHSGRAHDLLQEPAIVSGGLSWVLVRNESGSPRDRFDILGLNGPLIEPATNLAEFQGRVVLRGRVPVPYEDTARFAVLLEPVPAGGIVRACVSGVCIARCLMNSEAHKYASPHWWAGYLHSGPTGCELLWVQPPEQRPQNPYPHWAWCVVRLQSFPLPYGDVRLVRVIRQSTNPGIGGTGVTHLYNLYEYVWNTSSPPNPLPEPVAVNVPYNYRFTYNGVGQWLAAPDWSVAVAQFQAYTTGVNRYKLLWCDEQLPTTRLFISGQPAGYLVLTQ
ncbi:MAG: hypothetical protein IPM13_00505 [Phycisphaerales bacterium]|nr:hypothetical protein [Phycisphaerales bacterium]